ncbi:ATP-binding protein [Streptomyces sp. NBC_01803]|uniref:ATP-binding protein n=1 Tax=Streptomyces sp. NBC_01803 TaxID=2975946 RepID=UPI002DD9DC26|nr:ATP-binding protein [Streptomyces sp. NBC_01803]WSA43228.1 ATP-binding protein [Streptomyces sp. NBC_01803]
MAVPVLPIVEEPHLVAWDLTARPCEIGQWRDTTADVLKRWDAAPDAIDFACLGVTELLVNVGQHAGDPRCRLVIRRRQGSLYLLVRDRSAVLPVLSEPDWTATSGRGLWLLREMAGALGCLLTSAPGKWVWVRYDAPGAFVSEQLRPRVRQINAASVANLLSKGGGQ